MTGRRINFYLALGFTLFFCKLAAAQVPSESEVLAAMKKATHFMMNTVSNRGGFLWHYSADLSQQWGEVPARKSQIWAQPPGTPTVGTMLLQAYKTTGDLDYLNYVRQVAGALIFGQHPTGGWHYFIDFDPQGIREWYDEVASQCRAWEEFYYYYGNCTFDDDSTTAPIRFLLDLYLATFDPVYREPLVKGLDFVLQSQYPNGAWPQRYPLRHDFSFEGRPDYTSFYSFNDDVISNNIYLLLEAYEKLGNERYKAAARKGMDFYLLSQLGAPQGGWALQYDPEMRPAQARSYEPASLCLDQTIENLKDLENFYRLTGDRRYLSPFPSAIQWIEKSFINTDPKKNFTHANFYEFGTNRPLAVHHEHRKLPDGRLEIVRYWSDYELGEDPFARSHPASENKSATGYHLGTEYQDSHYKSFEPRKIDVAAIKTQYEELQALPWEQVRVERGIQRPPRFSDRRAEAKGDAAEVKHLIISLGERGAWITDIEFLDTMDFTHNPPTAFKGIDTGTYVSNMYKLINFLKGRRKSDSIGNRGITSFLEINYSTLDKDR